MPAFPLDPGVTIGLSALAAIVGAPFLLRLIDHLHLLTRHRKTDYMAVSSAAQTVADELNAAAANLTAALSHAEATATAQAAEDLAAIKTAAEALVAAINAANPPPPAPPVE